MTQPTPFMRSYSYTNSFAANPTQVFPGSALDAELNDVQTTTNDILQNLTLLQNDDGSIRNGSIGTAQLSVSLQIGFTVPTVWSSAIAYSASPASTVFENNGFYSCLVSHTSSSSFAADLAAGYWTLIANLSTIPLQTANNISITPSGGIVTTDVQDAMYGLDTRITSNTTATAANSAALADITSSEIVDSTATGRALMTAASADVALAAINGFSTGDLKLTLKTTADTGWLMMNDGTIGSASSGATYANAYAQNLYVLFWTNISNTYAPVTGGRGVTAAADWAANKPIALTAVLGRALAIAGSGSGLTAATLGETIGSNAATIAQGNLPSVNFTVSGITLTNGTFNPTLNYGDTGGVGGSVFLLGANPAGSGSPASISAVSNVSVATQGVAASGGLGTGLSVMQPTSFLNVMVKL